MTIIDAYKALADESRLRVLSLLQHASLSVQDLTRILGLGQSTVSHHLKVLTLAQMVQSQKSGTWIYYHLYPVDSAAAKDSGAHLAHQFVSQFAGNLSNGLSHKLAFDLEELSKILAEKRTATKNFFDSIAADWKALRSEMHSADSYVHHVLQRITPNETLLELGCGAGALLDAILPRTGKTIAVDYSQPMLDAARKNLGALAQQVELRLGHLEHLPIADEAINTAVSYMVLHHVTDPYQVFTDVFRTLIDGGRFIIIELENAVLPQAASTPPLDASLASVWSSFEKQDLKKWLVAAGFHISEEQSLSKHAYLITGVKPTTQKGI
jgi:ubiquinone/menaquinone biosynthesis C-methylase UbiE/DNA-binding transcriptional ArsR family regulator